MNIKTILGLVAIGLLLFTMYIQSRAITKQSFEIKALKLTIEKQDSINASQYDELFDAQTRAGRYEIALELLKEEDKAAANKFKHILENETEQLWK